MNPNNQTVSTLTPGLSIELTRAVLIFTPAQHEQYHRPLETNLTRADVDRVIHDTQGMTDLTAATLAHSAGSLIAPSVVPRQQVSVPNGLGEDKLAFFIEITISSQYGPDRRELVSGFTDYVGVTSTGAIDPNMVFYVNSITSLGPSNRIIDSAQVLTPEYAPSAGVPLRPVDVVATSQTNCFSVAEDLTSMIDSRTLFTNSPKLATQHSNASNRYLSDTLKGYSAAIAYAEHTQMADDVSLLHDDLGMGNDTINGGLYDEVISRIRPTSAAGYHFFSAMGLLNGGGDSSFTFSQLERRWPRDGSFYIIALPTAYGAQQAGEMDRPLEYSESWNTTLLETQIAHSILHILPSILTQVKLLSCELHLTNENIGGQTTVTLMAINEMFENTFTPSHQTYMEDQIMIDIATCLLANRVDQFSIHLKCNLLGNVMTTISLNGMQPIVYIAPMFCHSFYSPQIGTSHSDLAQLSQNVDILVNEMVNQRDIPQQSVSGNVNLAPAAPTYQGQFAADEDIIF